MTVRHAGAAALVCVLASHPLLRTSTTAQTSTADDAPADRPAPRLDENSKIAHAELLQKRTKGRIDVYFIGDSITRRWGATDYPELLANWNANFFGWNAADFGWGADRIEHILSSKINMIRPRRPRAWRAL